MIRRAFSLLLGLWLCALVAEPQVLHACPMHDGHAVVAESAAPDPHAGHRVGAAPADDASTPADATHCQCLGECSAAATTGIPTVGLSLAVARVVTSPVHIERTTAHALRAPDLLLPFADGPPVPLTA